jgi:tetratricopeptide (TPR) repeat protein
VHTLLDQADQALRARRLEDAHEAADAARAHAETLAHATDGEDPWLGECGACWDRLGEIARIANAPTAALDAFSRAVEFRRMARERDIHDHALARRLAAALLKHGEAALALDAIETARASFDESVNLRSRLLDASPDDPRAALALAAALERRGLAAAAAKDTAVARGAWEDELTLAPRIFAEDDLEGVRFRAIVESHLAGLGGPRGEESRKAALALFDELSRASLLSEHETALRRKLWDG